MSGQPPKRFFCAFWPCHYQTDQEDEARQHYNDQHFGSCLSFTSQFSMESLLFNKWTKDFFYYQDKLFESMSASPRSLPMKPYQKKSLPLYVGCPVCRQIIRLYNLTNSANIRDIEIHDLTQLDYSLQRKHCNEHLCHKPITCIHIKLDNRTCNKKWFTYRGVFDHFKREHNKEDLDEVKKFVKINDIKEISELLLRNQVKPDRWPNKRCCDGSDSTASKKKKTPEKTPPLVPPSTTTSLLSRLPQSLTNRDNKRECLVDRNSQINSLNTPTMVVGKSSGNGQENNQEVVPLATLIQNEEIPKELLKTPKQVLAEFRQKESIGEAVGRKQKASVAKSGAENDQSFNSNHSEQNSLALVEVQTSNIPSNQLQAPLDLSRLVNTSKADESRDLLTQPVNEVVQNNKEVQNVEEKGETSSRDGLVIDLEPPTNSEIGDHQVLENGASNNISTLPLVKEERNQLESSVDATASEIGNFFCLFCSQQIQSRNEAVVHYSNHLDLHLRCLHCKEKFVDSIEANALDAFEAFPDERKSLADSTDYDVGMNWINNFLDYQLLDIEQNNRRRDFCPVCYKINFHKMNFGKVNQPSVCKESLVEHFHRHLCYHPSFECRRCRWNSSRDRVERFKRGQEQQAIDHLRIKHQKDCQQIDFDSSEANFEKMNGIAKLDDLIRNCKEISTAISNISHKD